ncbi:DUF6916 family protein [Glaciibacter psychrotolerans]|uniref:DUF6916 domain-containing protein n=1 Tax=Glaciibacter psychrotolerans TaxID=670054 RepID=A0A7Z0EH80_9MICO|nr:hypothetical protein [Leifsonia psychrotolerans]NYJ21190.1 hypothetical protein [Leifsonia psychrotolerans]
MDFYRELLLPHISRRTAVTFGLGTLGLTALSLAANPATVGATLSALADALNPPAIPARSIFLGSVGKIFTAASEADSFPVTLAAIEDLAPLVTPDDEDRFNLLFASTDARFQPGIYRISRAGVPTTELFVSPVGVESKTRTLQALVNRQA